MLVVILSNLNKGKKKRLPSPAQDFPNATLTTMAHDLVKYVPVDQEGIAAQKKRAELPWGRDPFLSE